jgi:hypothetical protein
VAAVVATVITADEVSMVAAAAAAAVVTVAVTTVVAAVMAVASDTVAIDTAPVPRPVNVSTVVVTVVML